MGPCPELYAATPPIETFRTVISSATTGPREKGITDNDVSRAHIYADREGDIYVDPCDEDSAEDCDKGVCGKRVKATYGARHAAKMWQKEGTKTFVDAGFKAGETSPRIFHNAGRGIVTFLHGHDFVCHPESYTLRGFLPFLSFLGSVYYRHAILRQDRVEDLK